MRLVKVGAAVLNQTPLDWDRNKANILGAIVSAREQGVSLLCLPEMCVCGYGCDDMYLSAGLRRTARKMVMEILPHTRGMVVTLGLPVMLRSGLFNTCCVIAHGKIVGFVAKQNLCGDGIHYEPRWFKPWPATVRDSLEFEGETYPIGDLAFSFGGIAVGFEICEDAWVATRPGREHARIGIDIILNPSASHFAFGKHAVRQRFVLEGSRAFGVTYVYGNLLGNEAGRAIYDGGALIASGGELVAAGPRLTYDDYHVTSSVVDIDLTRMGRARLASFEPAIGTASSVVNVPFELPPAAMETAGGAVP